MYTVVWPQSWGYRIYSSPPKGLWPFVVNPLFCPLVLWNHWSAFHHYHFAFDRISQKGKISHTMYILLCPYSFPYHNAFEIHLCHCVYPWSLLPFYLRKIPFHCYTTTCLSIHSLMNMGGLIVFSYYENGCSEHSTTNHGPFPLHKLFFQSACAMWQSQVHVWEFLLLTNTCSGQSFKF